MPRYVVDREDDLAFLSAEYADLYERSDATLFQHPTWLDSVYRTLAPRRAATPLVVTVRCDGRLVGVLPFVLRRRLGVRRVEFADLGVCDYAAPVLDVEHAMALAADADVRTSIRAALGRFDLLLLERVRGSASEVAGLLSARTTRRHAYDTHAIALPATTDQWYTEALDPSLARHLERKRKRLRPKGGVRLTRVTDPGSVDELMARLRQFRRDRFAERRGTDLVQDPDCFAFYRQVAHDSLTHGGPVELHVLEVGDEVAAVALDLSDRQRHLFLIVGYDFARLRNYSLGLIIVDELVTQAIGAGQHTFDLTVGNEGYKSELGALPTPMYAVRRAVTPLGLVAAAGLDLEAAARRNAKRALVAAGHAPRSPLRPRHRVAPAALAVKHA